MGKLRGIHLTSTLRSTITEVLALPQQSFGDQVTSNVENDNERNASLEANADSMNTKDESAKASPHSSSSPRSTAHSTPAASLARVKETKRILSRELTVQEARSVLQSTLNNHDDVDSPPVLPLEQISALKLLISSSSSPEASTLAKSLDQALRTPLVFTTPTAPPSSNPAFEKRLAFLRQLNEERSYLASTSNIQKLNAHSTHDDINVKSMMYATSVGLNMIVAPVSFGVFMYFFAGSLFGRFFPANTLGNAVDVRRVIAGVLSGVILLFIEMILFVIRSHELDASVRKKKRKKEYKSNPFGYTSRAMERVYEGDE